MSLEYLEQLAQDIDSGLDYYACASQNSGQWFISRNFKDLRQKAQRAANSLRYEVPVYRLCNESDASSSGSCLIATKLLEPGLRGEPHIRWSLVDTREAALLLRDVSQGPTPFFCVVVQESFKPEEEAKI